MQGVYDALFVFSRCHSAKKEKHVYHRQPLTHLQSAVGADERWHGRRSGVTAVTKLSKRHAVIATQQFGIEYFQRLIRGIHIPVRCPVTCSAVVYVCRSKVIVQADVSRLCCGIIIHLPTETVCKWLTLPLCHSACQNLWLMMIHSSYLKAQMSPGERCGASL